MIKTQGPNETSDHLVPRHLTKQEFGRRLYKLMMARGWTQSELGRAANIPRDSVSTYIRGKTMPGEKYLSALADALGVTKAELLPNHIEQMIDEDEAPAFEMRISPRDPSVAWIRVNQLVSVTSATAIMQILEKDNAAHSA